MELVGAEELVFRKPALANIGVVREVFVSKDVHDLLEFANVDEDLERAAGRACAKLDAFIGGRTIVFGMDPYVKSPATLVSRNNPWQLGIVEFRVASYSPDLRLFGGFAQKDVLILLTWARKTGLKYHAEIRRCKATWDDLFPGSVPIIGSTVDEYVSNFLEG